MKHHTITTKTVLKIHTRTLKTCYETVKSKKGQVVKNDAGGGLLRNSQQRSLCRDQVRNVAGVHYVRRGEANREQSDS